MTCIIRKITHPEAYELRQARLDHAHITQKPMVERTFYYENVKNGEQYHDLYGCIAWPTEVTEKDIGRPGYVGIIAVLKTNKPVEKSGFLLMEEAESKDVATILTHAINFRQKYGYGLHPTLLSSWWGGPERFITTIALFNQHFQSKEILIAPPVDFYEPKAFDIYSHSMRSVITPGRVRFGFGNNTILMNRLQLYKRDDPAVLAVGGLIHTLLLSCEWMDQHQPNMFVLEEEGNV
jgi:hypothetical protein